MTVKIPIYRQICVECGSFAVEYKGSPHNYSRWFCESCGKTVKVKTKRMKALE